MTAPAHPAVSPFFAYVSRLRFIERWGLKRNAIRENVAEHSWEVAVIAHALACIRNAHFGGSIDANAVAAAALFHDASEVFTGDLPSPVKYHSPQLRDAYKAIEAQAQTELLAMLPAGLRSIYEPLISDRAVDADVHQIIKAADTLSAWLKSRSEINAGNREFSVALTEIESRLDAFTLPEVRYFRDVFAPAFDLTLDEILPPQPQVKLRIEGEIS